MRNILIIFFLLLGCRLCFALWTGNVISQDEQYQNFIINYTWNSDTCTLNNANLSTCTWTHAYPVQNNTSSVKYSVFLATSGLKAWQNFEVIAASDTTSILNYINSQCSGTFCQ